MLALNHVTTSSRDDTCENLGAVTSSSHLEREHVPAHVHSLESNSKHDRKSGCLEIGNTMPEPRIMRKNITTIRATSQREPTALHRDGVIPLNTSNYRHATVTVADHTFTLKTPSLNAFGRRTQLRQPEQIVHEHHWILRRHSNKLRGYRNLRHAFMQNALQPNFGESDQSHEHPLSAGTTYQRASAIAQQIETLLTRRKHLTNLDSNSHLFNAEKAENQTRRRSFATTITLNTKQFDHISGLHQLSSKTFTRTLNIATDAVRHGARVNTPRPAAYQQHHTRPILARTRQLISTTRFTKPPTIVLT